MTPHLRLTILTVVCLSGIGLSGCATSHSLEPGTWKLRVVGRPIQHDSEENRHPERTLVNWRLVNLKLGWRQDKKYGEIETVQIEDDRGAESPITGFVLPKKAGAELDVIGSDEKVEFRFRGLVRSAERVHGDMVARQRLAKDKGFSGRFELVRLNEEDARLERRTQRIQALSARQGNQRKSASDGDRVSENDPRRNRTQELNAREIEELPEEEEILEPGIWSLEIKGRDTAGDSDEMQILLEPSKVYVHIDTAAESEEGDIPIKIHFTRNFEGEREAILGRIQISEKNPERRILNVLGNGVEIDDLTFDFRLKGRVRARDHVSGLVLMRDDQLGKRRYEGRFRMKKVVSDH